MEIKPIKEGNFKAKPMQLLVDKNYVLNTLQSSLGIVVDARMKKFYDVNLPGIRAMAHHRSENIAYTDMVDAENVFKPVDSLQRYFTSVARKEDEIVTYCL